jgi:hypothetical protein
MPLERHVSETSHSAEVPVKRGSTWIGVAPRSLAFMGQRKPTGWASAMFEPMITTAQAFDAAIGCQNDFASLPLRQGSLGKGEGM